MDLNLAREQMIDQQVRTWEVLDPVVLEVMSDLPRERFVPDGYRNLAYADTPIPIGQGQTMLTPKVEGRLLQALAVRRGDRALEVGTGSGYTAACLAALGASVTSLEIYPELVDSARETLARVGVPNVEILQQDATTLESKNQYDVIAVTGSVPVYDQRYAQALKPGGRLFIVVGQAPVMEAVLVTRAGDDDFIRESLFETVVPSLENVIRPAPFRF
ncbi:MAG: protein-L-isoaspartate O-methyltransferase [Gammaproteobacteria bacterium]|nr:protein-L-isoaspartate O-methyltransferase [Gammaproteobacteria bacterium]